MKRATLATPQRFTVICVCAAGLSTGCAEPTTSSAPDGALQIERTTTDGVTTVRNLAGSKWTTPATAFEEVTIGVLEGSDEYMLAQPTGAWLTDDSVWVVDRQDHRVIVYDFEGTYVREIGQQGQGPGEFDSPMGLAVQGDRVIVASGMQGARVAVFTTDGEHVEDWSLGFNPAFQFFIVGDHVYTQRFIAPESPEDRFERPQAFQAIGREGFIGEPTHVPDLGSPTTMDIPMRGRTFPFPVPMAPRDEVWSISPNGELIVGFPDAYRFEIRELDGKPKTVVERYWDPVPIDPGEAENSRRMTVTMFQRQMPDFAWDGAEIPATKPAYDNLFARRDGYIWVSRSGVGKRVDDCDEPEALSDGGRTTFRSCWTSERTTDLFDMDGSYLGTIETATGSPFFPRDVYGGRAVSIIQSEDGAPQVKIWKIVLPDAGDS